MSHVEHPVPARLGFFPSSQAVHLAAAMPVAAVGASHVLQPSTPTYALPLTVVPRGFPHASTDWSVLAAPGILKY